MKYVLKPNLPQNAGIILIGEKYSDILRKPMEMGGIKVIFVPDNPHVDSKVSGHTDLSVLHLGGKELFLAPYLKGSSFENELSNLGFDIFHSEIEQKASYPYDAGLNICICGNKLIYNPRSADEQIVDYLTNTCGLEKIAVRQGYSKCSVCVVNENAIITSDIYIHKRAVEAGLDSLLIEPGYFQLDGFDYGFIGGSSFKLNYNTLAFTGVIDGHPNKNDIVDFACLHNTELVYITKKVAFDIGSAIQIVEK